MHNTIRHREIKKFPHDKILECIKRSRESLKLDIFEPSNNLTKIQPLDTAIDPLSSKKPINSLNTLDRLELEANILDISNTIGQETIEEIISLFNKDFNKN